VQPILNDTVEGYRVRGLRLSEDEDEAEDWSDMPRTLH
jgi:hypothetical protein